MCVLCGNVETEGGNGRACRKSRAEKGKHMSNICKIQNKRNNTRGILRTEHVREAHYMRHKTEKEQTNDRVRRRREHCNSKKKKIETENDWIECMATTDIEYSEPVKQLSSGGNGSATAPLHQGNDAINKIAMKYIITCIGFARCFSACVQNTFSPFLWL